MTRRLRGLLERTKERFPRLPVPLLLILALLFAGLVGGGGYYAYQTYDYIEHDNEFCLSCHLMVEPYEQFAQSAHRGLGCKACHQPTFVTRSTMALTQILENPPELEAHAEVPNRTCANCHIRGDPEKWEIIKNSAGHRIHLESDDPALEGLMCVECHSTSVHQFSPSTRTCGQSGCHEDTGIRLGEMADLTIHCSACHGFVNPIGDDSPEAVQAAMQPNFEACLSCHAMRQLIQLPEDEPHDGVCAACHNPHEQTEAAEAAESCSASGCHTRPDTLTSFHRGLDPGVLENCVMCHPPHEFRVEGANCVACHDQILRDEGAGPTAFLPAARPASPAPLPPGHPATATLPPGHPATALPESRSPAAAPLPAGHPAVSFARLERPTPHAGSVGGPSEEERPLAGAALLHDAGRLPPPPQARGAQTQQRDTIGTRPRFLHSNHRQNECLDCHTTETTHGRVAITSIADCRQCHHTGPAAGTCSRCHQRTDVRHVELDVTRSIDLSVGRSRSRTLPFDHAIHEMECSTCHTAGLALSASGLDCSSCHAVHHEPERSCMSCHERPPPQAHTVEVHVGCTGSGCHAALPSPIRDIPRVRSFCLVCHQDLTDHRPGRNCAQCHALPSPRGGAAEAEGVAP